VSQPCTRNCTISQPGEVDQALGEFWSGSPWDIINRHNLSCFERNRVYLNVAGGNFVDISHLTGADSDGDGRAVVAADFNGDGRVDLAVRQAGGGPLLLLENQFPEQNYLKLTLRGRTSNRLGIGARVDAQIGERHIVREVYPANGFRSQAPLVVHLGLADATEVSRLTIRWPSGAVQELAALPANRHVVVTEGSDAVELVVPGTTIAP
jgi:hypothetical protein